MNFVSGYMGGFGWIFMVVFWGLVIWAIVSLMRGNFGNGHGCGHDHDDGSREKDKSPLDILKKRYARGEITNAQFEKMKKDL